MQQLYAFRFDLQETSRVGGFFKLFVYIMLVVPFESAFLIPFKHDYENSSGAWHPRRFVKSKITKLKQTTATTTTRMSREKGSKEQKQ